MKLKEKAKKFPDSSGVYMFSDNKGSILYIGRAISLKRRILNYFQKTLDLKTKEMVGQAKSLSYKKTENLLEAIILEANLIKKHWPKYNIREKDNRSFVYIVITNNEYPKLIIVRQRELDKFPKIRKTFGPYQSYYLIEKALKIIRRIFPYSTCKPFSDKPCFHHQIGLCPGVCVGRVSKKEYMENIKNIILLLSGNKKRLVKKLEKESPEKAVALRHIQDATLVSKDILNTGNQINRIEGYDISHLSGKEPYGAMVVFTNSQPDKKEYRLFKIKTAPKYDDLRALREVLIRRFKHLEWSYPDLILIDGGKPQIDYVSKLFNKMNIKIPLIGISKYGNDKLVFPSKTKKSIKDLAKNIKGTLLKIRDEAHRFSLKSSRKKREKIN